MWGILCTKGTYALIFEYCFIVLPVLTVTFLSFQESTLGEGCDPNVVPDKVLQEKEKALLEKYKLVLKAFLHDHLDLQVTAVYSLQVFCYSNNFPKGN